MPFVEVPVKVGDRVKASQFKEVFDGLLERYHTLGITTVPTGLPQCFADVDFPVDTGDVVTDGLKQINCLRQGVEHLIDSSVDLFGHSENYWNPLTEKRWSDPPGFGAFFTAAGIGDNTNWTRVPVRDGGLTVSSRLVKGDIVYAEHINEIRKAIINFKRIGIGLAGSAKGSSFEQVGSNVGPVFATARLAAIVAANAAVPTASAAREGFSGSASFDGANYTVGVRIRRVFRGAIIFLSNAPALTAPTPFIYAGGTSYVAHRQTASIFNGAPPPINDISIMEVRTEPTGSFVFPPTVAAWKQGNVLYTFDLVDGAPRIQNGTLSVLALPTGAGPSPSFFFCNVGIFDDLSDRTGWVAPIVGGPTTSIQDCEWAKLIAPPAITFDVHVDITNFVFQ